MENIQKKISHRELLLNVTSYSSGPNVKILLTLASQRYTSNFDIGRKLGQCGI